MEKEQLISTVLAAQNGDQASLNTLFNEYYNDVYYFAFKTVKEPDLACDITQETFIEIINTLGNLNEPAAFVSWMKCITYHQCTRYFKKKKDVLVDEGEEGETIFDTVKEESADFIPDEALDKDDFRKTILNLLDELSEEQRSATMMYYFDELSVKQIAEIQNVSEGTVKSRLNYARKALKASVEDYEKKNGIKLHAIPFFPMLKWVFGSSVESITTATAETIASTIAASTGAQIGIGASVGASAAAASATAATTTAATTATTATAAATGIGAKIAALPIVTKIIAGITAATIAIGGGTAVVMVSNNNNVESNSSEITSSTVDGYGGPSDETLTVLEGVIPDGCTYTLHDGTVLTAGQKFPDACTKGDKVQYGDYYYGYECIYIRGIEGSDEYAEDWLNLDETFDTGDSGVTLEDILGCWTPAVQDRAKSAYGNIASSINGKTINNLFCTFQNCKNMITAPAIPETVTSISMAYYKCSRLETAPVIPKSVKRYSGAFWDTNIGGEVVINGSLDKSFHWYYGDVFRDTYTEINLTGEMSEEELFMIAEGSNNPQITVNGKPVVFYYDTDRLTNGITNIKQLIVNAQTFYKEEPAAGYSGDYESGEECSSIYSAHALADHFMLFDVFGYNINVEEFMLLNLANGDVHYTFTKDNDMTSDFQVQYILHLNFRTSDEIITQLKRDIKIFKQLIPNYDMYIRGKNHQTENISDITNDTYKKIANGDCLALVLYNYDTSASLGAKLSVALGCELVDGHYVYSLSFGINVSPEIILS